MPVQPLVETDITLNDKVSGPLAKIGRAAFKAHGTFASINSTLMNLVGVGGAVGGALSFVGAVKSTQAYLKNLKEVRELTGASAAQTDSLFSNARKAGVEYQQMQGIMFQLSRRGAMLESQANGSADGAKMMARQMKKLGIDISKGPVNSIIEMSKQVKAGKMSADDLMGKFRIPQGAVNDFTAFLKDLDTTKIGKGDGLISDKDVDNFDALESAQHRFHNAWNRIQVTVGAKLMPGIARVMETIADKMEELVPAAQKFGEYLVTHMEKAVKLATTFAKIMFAQKAFDMVTMGKGNAMVGKGALGALNFVRGGSISGALGKGAKSVGGAFAGAGKSAAAGLGSLANPMTMIKAIPAALGQGAKHLMRFVGGAARLSLVGVAITAAIEFVMVAVDMIKGNVLGLTDTLTNAWESIKARFAVIGDLLEPVISPFKAGGAVRSFFEVVVATTLTTLADAVDGIMKVLQTIIISVKKAMESPRAMMNPVKLFGDSWAEAERLTRKKIADNSREDASRRALAAANRGDESVQKKGATPYYDFRGSRFDITQSFAEGFDPDRIAVAFTSDLASMADQKMQSGFSPLFAVR